MKKLLCNFCKKECVEIVSLRHFFYKCENCKNIKRSFTKKINLFDFFYGHHCIAYLIMVRQKKINKQPR